jgi:microcystin-dependent protein
MSDQFIGEIRIFPFGFAPLGWLPCDGALVDYRMADFKLLYTVIGTSFGSDGGTKFAVPNLQGAVPVGAGAGPQLSAYTLGQAGGAATVTLSAAQNAMHFHAVSVDQETATQSSPAGGIFMEGHAGGGGQIAAYSTLSPVTALSGDTIAPAGGGQAHNNLMAFLTMNFCIAYQGIYPSPG